MKTLELLRAKLDPRWFLILSNSFLVLTGFFLFHLRRSGFQVSSAILGAITFEFLAAQFLPRFHEVKVFDRILSAVAIAMSLLILTNSTLPYFYLITVGLAVFSKYLIRQPNGRHIYNPTNFALIATYALFSPGMFSAYPDEFALRNLPYFSVCIFGVLATTIARTHWVVISYVIGVIGMSLIFAPVFQMPFFYLLAPDIGLIGLIFMFFMITDPRTTPTSRNGKIAFGLSVAVASILLRNYEVASSYFVALFIVTTLYQSHWVFGRKLPSIRVANEV